MGNDLVVEILLGVLALAVGVGSFLGAGRAEKTKAVSVQAGIEANAYATAKTIYEGAISSLEKQLTRLRNDLEEEVAKLRESNRQLQQQVAELQAANVELADSNHRLLVQVRELTRQTPPGGMAANGLGG